MQVTERMQALGDHAKSSRQPPLRERKRAKADESAAKQDPIDETILQDRATHDSAVAAVVDEVTSQIAAHESGNGGAVAEISPNEGADDIATTQARLVQEDDATSAKRAIVHEWENWSALHSDELGDPNVAEYFFRHLEAKKEHLLNFGSIDPRAMVRKLIVR